MKASEFDEKFEGDEDLTAFLDLPQARRPCLERTEEHNGRRFARWLIDDDAKFYPPFPDGR